MLSNTPTGCSDKWNFDQGTEHKIICWQCDARWSFFQKVSFVRGCADLTICQVSVLLHQSFHDDVYIFDGFGKLYFTKLEDILLFFGVAVSAMLCWFEKIICCFGRHKSCMACAFSMKLRMYAELSVRQTLKNMMDPKFIAFDSRVVKMNKTIILMFLNYLLNDVVWQCEVSYAFLKLCDKHWNLFYLL